MKYVDPYGLFPCPGAPQIECDDAITVTGELPDFGGFLGFLGFSAFLRNLQLFDGGPSTGFGLFDVQTAQHFYRTGFEESAGSDQDAIAFVFFAVDDLFVPGSQAELGVELASAMIPGGKPGNLLAKYGNKTARELIPGSLKRLASYREELAHKTYAEIVRLSKGKGSVANAARQMKKLIEQSPRLQEKGRTKPGGR